MLLFSYRLLLVLRVFIVGVVGPLWSFVVYIRVLLLLPSFSPLILLNLSVVFDFLSCLDLREAIIHSLLLLFDLFRCWSWVHGLLFRTLLMRGSSSYLTDTCKVIKVASCVVAFRLLWLRVCRSSHGLRSVGRSCCLGARSLLLVVCLFCCHKLFREQFGLLLWIFILAQVNPVPLRVVDVANAGYGHINRSFLIKLSEGHFLWFALRPSLLTHYFLTFI